MRQPRRPAESPCARRWVLPRCVGEAAAHRAAPSLTPRAGVTVRSAFTLLELLLVLAILAIVSAIVVPSLFRPLESQRLTRAGEALCAALGRARVVAIDQGAPVTLAFSPEAGDYAIQTLDGQGIPGEPARKLPEEVVFLGATVEGLTADGQIVDPSALAGAAASADFGGAGVVFFPDGSSTTAEYLLRSREGAQLFVRLRGLTGQAHLGEVVPAREAAP